MTREEATDVIRWMLVNWVDSEDKHKALQMAITALEQPECKDTVSRQAAIDELRTCQTYLFDTRDKDKKISLESAEWAIEGLPPAQPEQRWISCKKRLPKEMQEVYTTVYWNDYGDYITAYGMRTKFGWHLMSTSEGELIKGYTVIAWMPLPEPWKEGEACAENISL